MTDLRYALRSLAKTPGFAAVAILTLALCIGANSAVFSVVRAILLKPYPWPQSENLVFVHNTYPLMGLDRAGSSIPDYLDRRQGVSSFEESALVTGISLNLALDGAPERLEGRQVTPSLFPMLKVAPALGRPFTEQEAQPGAPKTVVLSDALWRNRFGADPKIVGRDIRLNGEPYTVTGVMPPDFYFPTPRTQVWVPFVFTDRQRSDEERGNEFSSMIARLRSGATIAQAQREVDAIHRANVERRPDSKAFVEASGFSGLVLNYLEENVRDVKGMLWLVQAGVLAALLIGCANVASLLLARASARERELAIRAALGASRARIVRQLLLESLVLFLAGAAGGLVVALWGVSALNGLGISQLPRGFAVTLDGGVFAFTLVSALVTGLAFGAIPAWSATQGNTASALKDAGTRATASRRHLWLRSSLVVGEIALALMLLSTAGLLLRSFQRLQDVSPGFVRDHVLTAQVALPARKYDSDQKLAAFHTQVLREVQSLPGVKSAGWSSTLPFSGSNSEGSYDIEGYTPPAGQPGPHGMLRFVSPDYFSAIGITLLRGRNFTAADAAGAADVVIIDRILADRYWPGLDPIGRVIARDTSGGGATRKWTVIGVVAPVKNSNLELPIRKETLYFPIAQSPQAIASLVVKTSQDPAALIAPVRAAILAVDPEQPVYDLKTMTTRLDESLQHRRAPMILIGLFAGISLLLAALGVYGVLAFAVGQRTAEFGIRLALGATPGGIRRLVLRQGAGLVGLGVLAGLAGYALLATTLGRLLYGIAPTDPATLLAAPTVLALVALAACLIPARRATQVDPMVALRAD